MVTILISAAFIGAARSKGEALISMWTRKNAALNRGRRLFEARRLLEEIRYACESVLFLIKLQAIGLQIY